MESASLIIATFALLIAVANSAFLLGKFLFSEHKIQMVPIDQEVPGLFDGMQAPGSRRPQSLDFKTIDDPLDDDEKAYFEKFNSKKAN